MCAHVRVVSARHHWCCNLVDLVTIFFSSFEMGEADWVLNWWKELVTSAPPEALPEPGKVHCPAHHDRESRTATLFSVSDDAAQPRCELWLMTQKQLDTWCPKEGSVQRSHQQLACCATDAIAPFKFKMEWCLGCAVDRDFKLKKEFVRQYDQYRRPRPFLKPTSRLHTRKALPPIQSSQWYGTISDLQEAAPSTARRGQMPSASRRPLTSIQSP